jgi:eukaryotic-like serine/threonine-protein kinase
MWTVWASPTAAWAAMADDVATVDSAPAVADEVTTRGGVAAGPAVDLSAGAAVVPAVADEVATRGGVAAGPAVDLSAGAAVVPAVADEVATRGGVADGLVALGGESGGPDAAGGAADGVDSAAGGAEQWYAGPPEDPDRFELLGCGIRGGEGTVWQARYQGQLSAPLTRALKQLRPPPGAGPGWPAPADLRRWEDQRALLQELRIEHLVAVYDVFLGPLPHPAGRAGTAGDLVPYVEMEWVFGDTLADRVGGAAATARTLPERLGWIEDLAVALRTMHSAVRAAGNPVLHRDVKPANAIVHPDRGLVLVDVSTIRPLADGHDPDGRHTPPYTAPEVLADPHAPRQPASEVYALGALAAYCLTGIAPPAGLDQPAARDDLRRRLRVAARRAGIRRPDRHVDHLLAALDPDPERRPTDVVGWAHDLARTGEARTGSRSRWLAAALVVTVAGTAATVVLTRPDAPTVTAGPTRIEAATGGLPTPGSSAPDLPTDGLPTAGPLSRAASARTAPPNGAGISGSLSGAAGTGGAEAAAGGLPGGASPRGGAAGTAAGGTGASPGGTSGAAASGGGTSGGGTSGGGTSGAAASGGGASGAAAVTPTASISSPGNQAAVPRCSYLTGADHLPAGNTLLLAVVNLDNDDPNEYLQPIFDWETAPARTTWRGAQYFGAENDSIGQHYRVELRVTTIAEMQRRRAALGNSASWSEPRSAPFGRRLATVTVHRVAGNGAAYPCHDS